MFNKRIFLLLFLLIITIGAISSVSASDMDGFNNDTMKFDDSMDVSDDSNQISESNVESDEVLAASDEDVLQDNTNGRAISQLEGLIKGASSGGKIDLKFDYYCNSSTSVNGIVIDKPITINGNGHTIDANGYSRIFYIASDGVVINDLTFQHGWYYNPNYYFTGHGGAVYIEKGTTTFNNCNFYNNTAEQNGGAICSGAGLVLNKCEFVGNVANGVETNVDYTATGKAIVFGFGGAIYAFSPIDGNKEIRITDSTFSDNAARAAGAIYIDYLTQNFNSHECPYSLKCFIKNTEFWENYALFGGGAIYNCRDLDITDSGFYFNIADGSGGAIVLENGWRDINYYMHYVSVNLEVHGNTVFSNNQAKESGGAILHSYTNYGYESMAEDDIGAVKIDGNALFDSNRGRYGGALYVPEIEANVNNARFVNNYANNDGGAMYGGTAIDCTFSGNSNPQTYSTKIMNSARLTISQSGSNWNDKTITATLTNGNDGSAIASQYVSFNLNGKVTRVITNSRGQAVLNVGVPGSYSVTVSYAGNNKYTAASAKASFVVLKTASKVIASKKTFKLKVKTKKYAITLKDNLGRAIKSAKVSINVKGKTYKATTNANGKATFKINKLNKKGNFNAKIKFAGNAYYNAVTKSVKIKVK